MTNEWIEYNLADLYSIRSGLSKPAKDFGEGYPFLSFKDVFYNYFLPDELTQLVRSNDNERDGCSIKRGDVFLTRTSETMNELGMSSVARKDYPEATFNGFSKRLRPSTDVPLHPEYVGYFMRSPYFRNEMMAFSTMSTRASLNNEMIGRLKITLPPFPEQKAIAHILGSLDDKIELNRRMNETLEGMAQALFKSWFVDFDPVIDNALEAGNPIPEEFAEHAEIRGQALNNGSANRQAAKLFPAAFQLTEEVGWIPEGWEVKSLDKIADYRNGLALQKFRPKTDENPLPIVKIAQLKAGQATWDEVASPSISPECIIDDGDVVFSWSGSLMIDIWCGGKAALNQHLFKVTSTDFPKWFYLSWSNEHLHNFQRIAADKAVTMGHIKRSHLADANCAIPDRTLLAKGSEIINPYIAKIIGNRLQNRALVKLRSTLLPKLISGELRIPDAEKLVGAAL